jgi:hypothetical protein
MKAAGLSAAAANAAIGAVGDKGVASGVAAGLSGLGKAASAAVPSETFPTGPPGAAAPPPQATAGMRPPANFKAADAAAVPCDAGGFDAAVAEAAAGAAEVRLHLLFGAI